MYAFSSITSYFFFFKIITRVTATPITITPLKTPIITYKGLKPSTSSFITLTLRLAMQLPASTVTVVTPSFNAVIKPFSETLITMVS